jgi:hypothetical protein
VLRIEIEPLNRLDWSQDDTQLQLYVPSVTTRWAWCSSLSTVAAVISTRFAGFVR